MTPARQLPLALRLRDEATFDNFWAVTERQRLARQALQALVTMRDYQLVCLCGSAAVGRSHLLQAACHAGVATGLSVAYLPLGELMDAPLAEMLPSFEACDLVCLDDVPVLVGDRPREEALFHALNRWRDRGSRVAVAVDRPPGQWTIGLPDLRSRLAEGTVVTLDALDDAAKQDWLREAARRRGLVLAPAVARYWLHHYPRDLDALEAQLERLDRASLAAQRRLTIPFLRSVLES